MHCSCLGSARVGLGREPGALSSVLFPVLSGLFAIVSSSAYLVSIKVKEKSERKPVGAGPQRKCQASQACFLAAGRVINERMLT